MSPSLNPRPLADNFFSESAATAALATGKASKPYLTDSAAIINTRPCEWDQMKRD